MFVNETQIEAEAFLAESLVLVGAHDLAVQEADDDLLAFWIAATVGRGIDWCVGERDLLDRRERYPSKAVVSRGRAHHKRQALLIDRIRFGLKGFSIEKVDQDPHAVYPAPMIV